MSSKLWVVVLLLCATTALSSYLNRNNWDLDENNPSIRSKSNKRQHWSSYLSPGGKRFLGASLSDAAKDRLDDDADGAPPQFQAAKNTPEDFMFTFFRQR